jgi:hypothetical protein
MWQTPAVSKFQLKRFTIDLLDGRRRDAAYRVSSGSGVTCVVDIIDDTGAHDSFEADPAISPTFEP